MTRARSRMSEAAQRFAERRRKEDEAPRLSDQVPQLATLKLEMEERSAVSVGADNKYVRHVMVDNAPALFEVPCGDPACRDGGHDLTAGVLRELRSNAERFEAQGTCRGMAGNNECRRMLRLVGMA